MENFICNNCRFKFRAERPSRCPYCDKGLIEKEKSADELINEISSLMDD